jgi:hypothetical protein
MMLFHQKYLYEATGRRCGRAPTTSRSRTRPGRPVRAGDRHAVRELDAQTHTETEKAFAAGFIAMAGNLALLLNGIGLAVAFTILLVSRNTMSMAVRERRTEIGVLKTLGFSSAQVMGWWWPSRCCSASGRRARDRGSRTIMLLLTTLPASRTCSRASASPS